MKLRTAEQLCIHLQSDLAWRRKEIRVFEGMVKGSAGAHQQAVLRGAVAALYAHWEGCVKTSSDAYVDFVRLQGLQICELQPSFIGLIVRGRVKHLATSGKADDFSEFVRWLLREWQSRAFLPPTEKLSTQSNLNSAVFRDIVAAIGLPYLSEYQKAEKTIIEPLLTARNHLAHGEWEHVEQTTFEQYSMWTDKLMVLFCGTIEDAAISGRFRRSIAQLA